jgi:uncharacterized protein
MEFDWSNLPFEWDSSLTPRDVEESFEDPFAVRLLPDSPGSPSRPGSSTWAGRPVDLGVFSVYRTNGKQIRVLYARPFDPEEQFFYQRKLNQSLS